MAVDDCRVKGILESIEDIRAGIPRRLPDGNGGINEVVGRVLRPLRALRLESTADQSENELIKACAKSLQFIEVKTREDWPSPFFCLDIGPCSKLRTITLEGTLDETSTISNLVALLSTLQNPQELSRIRFLASNFSFLDFDTHSPAQPELWQWLDDILCGVRPYTRKEDSDALTFQVASRKMATSLAPSGYLVDLLPNFSRIGNCEEVEL
ncbi:hypothetical protein BDM02DRAFT_3117170 [Thelephora ganbajun]|uniref:Uncharacterized protein n=1 Tax=Thelephora ganbajun TaxID=370292 RepID=A0ACB6ZCM9_THEGA|nr:hypothetical protein BDM02DRAFT_3117170 [Thelephora ganbajun]